MTYFMVHTECWQGEPEFKQIGTSKTREGALRIKEGYVWQLCEVEYHANLEFEPDGDDFFWCGDIDTNIQITEIKGEIE